MASNLGGSQMSTLLESLPGIANVLRSPVADALVSLIRAAAGIGEFSVEDAEEMVQYATRRGLLDPEEGERVLTDIHEARKARMARSRKAKAATKSRSAKAARKTVTRKK